MSNRIEQVFRKRRKAFIAYITAGYPSPGMTGRLVVAFERAGVDMVELGVPFSDPIADGKTIQRSSQRALKYNINLRRILGMVRRIRGRSSVPIALMTYYNPVFRYGTERFVRDCLAAGVDGVIIPDLPPEESDAFLRFAAGKGFATILLIAPTSTQSRIRMICRKSTGFIYYVSLTGVTGARRRLPPQVSAGIRKIRRFTRKPVCVGFGISSPKQASLLAGAADGVIVGSALIDIIEKNLGKRDAAKAAARLVKRLARAVHRKT